MEVGCDLVWFPVSILYDSGSSSQLTACPVWRGSSRHVGLSYKRKDYPCVSCQIIGSFILRAVHPTYDVMRGCSD